MWTFVEITMIFLIVLLAFENILFLHGRLYQEQYHRIEDCMNNVPSSTSIFSVQNVQNIFRCLKLSQINLACQSFAYKSETTQCLQFRLKVDQCEDLDDVDNEAVTYKVRIILNQQEIIGKRTTAIS